MTLHDGGFKVVERRQGEERPYKIRYMGIFLVIETRSGLVVSWDRKTSVLIGLHQRYKVSAGQRGRLSSPGLVAGITPTARFQGQEWSHTHQRVLWSLGWLLALSTGLHHGRGLYGE